jgi:hypothetical protein
VDEHVTSEPPAPQQRQPHQQGSEWVRAAKWIAIVLILTGAGIYVFKSCIELPGQMAVKSGNTVREVGKALADVASAFRRGTITTSFESYATTITNQQYLQFATLRQMEIFTESDVQSLGMVDFEGVVEARAPVEYTYYVDFNGKWEFVLKDNIILVQAPPIRANKPAVDVSKLTYETKKYRPFLSAAAEKRLKQNLTGLISLRAKENIPLVKENGRKQIGEFVENWLAKSFTDGKVYAVKVYFPDEKRQMPLIQTNDTASSRTLEGQSSK